MEWEVILGVAVIIGVLSLIATVTAIFLTPFAMAFSFVAMGILPVAAINLTLSLLRKQRRLSIMWAPYLAWISSIIALTLLSIAANWRTTFLYGGNIEGAFAITVIEMTLTSIGVSAAIYSLTKASKNYRQVSETSHPSDSNMSFRPFAYWAMWFVGLFVLNWIIDMFYALHVGVNIQGPGPGWIDMVETWF